MEHMHETTREIENLITQDYGAGPFAPTSLQGMWVPTNHRFLGSFKMYATPQRFRFPSRSAQHPPDKGITLDKFRTQI